VFHTDLKTVEGDLSLYELGMIRRCLEKANRSFAERAVSAPKAEGNAGAMKSLLDAARDEEIVTVLEVRPRLKVRSQHSIRACCECVRMRVAAGYLPQGATKRVYAAHESWQQPRRNEEEADKDQGGETLPLCRAGGLRPKLGNEGACAASIL